MVVVILLIFLFVLFKVLSLMDQNESSMDLSLIALHLIHHDHSPEAVKLLSYHPPVLQNKEFYKNARIYIKEMVRCSQVRRMWNV